MHLFQFNTREIVCCGCLFFILLPTKGSWSYLLLFPLFFKSRWSVRKLLYDNNIDIILQIWIVSRIAVWFSQHNWHVIFCNVFLAFCALSWKTFYKNKIQKSWLENLFLKKYIKNLDWKTYFKNNIKKPWLGKKIKIKTLRGKPIIKLYFKTLTGNPLLPPKKWDASKFF